jgi:hypothetical protein
MDLRHSAMPGGEPAVPDSAHWRVPRGRAVLALTCAALLLLGGFVFAAGDRLGLWPALAAAVGLVAVAVRDLVAPVRLAADRAGVTLVVGFARHRRLAWSEIERVRLEARQRFGLRSELVEIDTGDSLHFFGAAELGAPAPEVVEVLTRLRDGSAPG